MAKKTCFVVAPVGESGSPTRKRSDQMLRHLVRPVLEPRGYDVKRADELEEEGLITHQIIERLLDDDLVIADLTGHNPNVFYELAVRHAAARAVVHLIDRNETIPFDVSNVRVVQYAIEDPDVLANAREEMSKRVDAIETSDVAGPNPVTAARDLQLLRSSGEPDKELAGELLTGLADLRAEVSALAKRVSEPALQAPHSRNQRTRYVPGDRVRHATFGDGEVVAIQGGFPRVRFDDGDEHLFDPEYAPMVRLEVE